MTLMSPQFFSAILITLQTYPNLSKSVVNDEIKPAKAMGPLAVEPVEPS